MIHLKINVKISSDNFVDVLALRSINRCVAYYLNYICHVDVRKNFNYNILPVFQGIIKLELGIIRHELLSKIPSKGGGEKCSSCSVV